MEQVTHPTHYNLDGRKECWDEMEELFGKDETFQFCVLSVYKYLYRAGEKEDAEMDLRKAETFLNHANELNKERSAGSRPKDFKNFLTVQNMLKEKREFLITNK